MWNVIGGFVISGIAEVFVKEIVKEIRKPGKPEASPQETPAKHLRHTKGQVIILDWMPAHESELLPSEKASKRVQRAAGRKKSRRRVTSSQRHE